MRAVLPMPPSVNHLYALTSRGGYARQYIPQKGQQWFYEAGLLLKSQLKTLQIDKPVAVTFWLYTSRFRDGSNVEKALFDLFQKAGILKNDAQIVEHHGYTIKVPHHKDEKVIIEIRPLIK